MEKRSNNFDALRLGAALLVIIGHSFSLVGDPIPRFAGIPIHYVGVYLFFAISGYLISTSWRLDPRLLPYLAKRALRIFPALAVVVTVTVTVIGPVSTRLPLGEYFAGAWSYLSSISLIPQYFLPGVFETHHSSAVNGALWTLGIEFLCYLVVAAIGIALRRFGAVGFAAFAIVAAILAFLPRDTWAHEFGITSAFFAVGALIATLKVPTRWWWVVVIVPVWVVLSILVPDATMPLAWLALPLSVLAVGRASAPGIRSAARFGDLSYGLYLWGFPVQQLVIEFLPPLPRLVDLVIVVPVTGLLAFASWHLVEKRALARKPARTARTTS